MTSAITAGTLIGDDGLLQSVQVFTASGTWTKPAGIKKVKVIVVGGGGGAGGCSSTDSSTGAQSSGGGGGGTSIKLIDVTSTSSETVTVGAGGAETAAGAYNGNAGGTSSFGAFCSATGGGGGLGATAKSGEANYVGGDGGVGTGGDVNLSGTGGGASAHTGVSFFNFGMFGGSSYLGAGANVPPLRDAGNAGVDIGAGASGNLTGTSTAARTGKAGADGIVIVEEYS